LIAGKTQELQLRLLGEFSVQTARGWTLHLPNRKDQALLAYLAMQAGKAVPRTTLAALLWGDYDDAAARHSLSQALTTLRKALPGKESLVAGKHSVSLRPSTFVVDALRFLELVDEPAIKALYEALAYYRGEFLEGFIVGEEAFEDWLQRERMRFRRVLQAAYSRLLEHYERSGQRQRAVDSCLMLLGHDPYNESVLRKLMMAYVQSGKAGEALHAYREFAARLERELKVEPDASTKEAYLRIVQSREPRKKGGVADAPSIQNELIGAFRSLDGFALWDERDGFVLGNDNYREILKPAADLLKPGALWEDIVRHCANAGRFPEATGRVEEWIAARKKTRKAGVTDTRDLMLDDGRMFRLAHWTTEAGGTAVVLTDITSRKQEPIDAFLAKGRFNALVEAIARPVLEIDVYGRVVFANALLHALLGYEPGQLAGRHCEELIASPRNLAREAGAAGAAASVRLAAQFVDKRGAVLQANVELASYPDQEGQVAGHLIVVKPA